MLFCFRDDYLGFMDPPYMNRLPNEILRDKIFKLLPFDDLKNVLLVCRLGGNLLACFNLGGRMWGTIPAYGHQRWSSAGAGEYVGAVLGLYHLTTDPESERQGPAVYRQLHDGQIQYYLYRWER